MLTAFHTGHPVKVAHEPIQGGPLALHARTPLPPGHHDDGRLTEAGS